MGSASRSQPRSYSALQAHDFKLSRMCCAFRTQNTLPERQFFYDIPLMLLITFTTNPNTCSIHSKASEDPRKERTSVYMVTLKAIRCENVRSEAGDSASPHAMYVGRRVE
jgi:hypothetical protein